MNPLEADTWVLNLLACWMVGGVAWVAGRAVHAGLRIPDTSRRYWLACWAFAVLPPCVAMTFQWILPAHTVTALPLPLPLPLGEVDGAWAPALAGGTPATHWPTAGLGPLLLAAYLLGAGVSAWRWLRGAASVRRLLRDSRVFNPALAGPLGRREIRQLVVGGVELRATNARISPFAAFWPQPMIVVSAALAAQLDDSQFALVLRHEQAHLIARDPQRAALLRAVGLLFWFNPFLPLIVRRIQLAAELCCDAAAIGAQARSRHSCAHAYLATLRFSAIRQSAVSAAFSAHAPDMHKLRLQHMLHGDPRGQPRWSVRALLAGLALATGSVLAAVHLSAAELRRPGVAAGTSAAIASDVRGQPVTAAAVALPTPVSAAAPSFRFPLAQSEITSGFGQLGSRARPHSGVDFRGRRGTPVHAPAAGVVIAATTRYRDAPQYGTVVVLDHGGGWQTLHAHLDRFDVAPGQRVATGERIGRTGATGKVTGPHLHMEVMRNGQRVDPEPLLR